MIFFRQKLHEVITLPKPPVDDLTEAYEVEKIFITYLIKVMKQLMVYLVLQKKENILVLMKLQDN